MDKTKKMKLKYIIVWVFIILIISNFQRFTGNIGSHNTGDVSRKIEEYLYEKYGEEFIADRIGLRTSRGQDFYQARIYPVSIEGTNKEWDDYYYATASVNKLSFGRLGGVGDGYGKVKMNISAEKYLLPKLKEIFGDRVKLKIDIKYKKREESGYFIQYLEHDFNEQLKNANDKPENNRLELDLQVYIFNRIDNEEEKELRRQQIFDFVQYLKEEGLFEYLEMGVIFIDERVLAPGYSDFRKEINKSSLVRETVDGEEVYLPTMSLRKEMSSQLQKEINGMSEEELLASMDEIRKSDLSYEGINKDNAQASFYLYSPQRLKTRYRTALEKGILIEKEYINKKEIEIENEFDYLYVK